MLLHSTHEFCSRVWLPLRHIVAQGPLQCAFLLGTTQVLVVVYSVQSLPEAAISRQGRNKEQSVIERGDHIGCRQTDS
jgi:hypothetical protein